MIVSSIARRFGTGSAPGNARHTGHVWLFGSPPKPFRQRQNIFVSVFSWTWISSPITGSQLCPPVMAQPLRDDVEADRLLERVRGPEERVLAELRPDQLQARPAGPPTARTGC